MGIGDKCPLCEKGIIASVKIKRLITSLEYTSCTNEECAGYVRNGHESSVEK